MAHYLKIAAVVVSLFMATEIRAQNAPVQFYYLGHSSFLILFDNGVSVLTDYGKPNAFLEWGWNSPIYDIGDFQPTIVTYSHTDEDHYDLTRTPPHVSYILQKSDTLTCDNISVYPIFTAEDSTSNSNNTSYLFNYKGIKVLHLGDCQANIIDIDSSDNKNYISSHIPPDCDVVLMPIEGKTKFIPQAEKFIELIHPKTVILMHYWSEEYKADFLEYIQNKNKGNETKYTISRINSSRFTYRRSDNQDVISVITLCPSKLNIVQ